MLEPIVAHQSKSLPITVVFILIILLSAVYDFATKTKHVSYRTSIWNLF